MGQEFRATGLVHGQFISGHAHHTDLLWLWQQLASNKVAGLLCQ